MAKRTKKNTEKIRQKQKDKTVKVLPKKQLQKPAKNQRIAIVIALLSGIVFWYFIPSDANATRLVTSKLLFNVASVILAGLVYLAFTKEKGATLIAGGGFFAFVLVSFSRILFFPLGNYSFTEIEQVLTFEVYRSYTYAPMLVFGLLTVWFNREKLNALIEKDISGFALQYEKNTPFFQQWLHKLKAHKALALILLVVVVGLTSTILLHKLGDFDFWSDEKQVTQAAMGYYKTGKFQQWDFVKDKPVNGKEFDRNFPHLWLLAQSYKIFGVSEWSSRIVSVLGGILFALLSYFILTYFFKNKFIVLLFLASFALHSEEILLFRWTRMYGILVPFFLFQFALAYKTLTTSGRFYFKNKKLNAFFRTYLDFNYKYLLVFIPTVILGYFIHKSTAFTLPALYFFIIYLAATERRPRFFIAAVLGLLFLGLGFTFFPQYIPTHVMTWFERNNTIYYDLLYFYPFTKALTLIVLAITLPILFFIKNKEQRKKLVYFYIMSIFVLILFVFVIRYDISFRYVSFLVPISMGLSFYALILLARIFLGNYFAYFIAFLILWASGTSFSNRYHDLYEINFPSKSIPSKAYKEIKEHYKTGEAIFYQFPMHYYFKGIDTTAQFVNMRFQKKYKYKQFLLDIKKYKSGWLEWDTQHAGHIDTLIYAYVNHNFKKIHGKGIDDTWTEVFRYDSTMVISADSFKTAQHFPAANLKMDYPFAISFWARMQPQAGGTPFIFDSYGADNKLSVFADSVNGFSFLLPDETVQTTGNSVYNGKYHHIVWQQGYEGERQRKTATLFLDGKQVNSQSSKSLASDFMKFKIGLQFKGELNEIRIYDKALSLQQVKAIYNNGNMTHLSKLPASGYYFEPINFWTRK